jgi:hypothetical protein
MSLRMHLYGWKLQEFIDAIGSKNRTLLKKASAHLEKTYKGGRNEADLPKALAWLRTLINEGHSLRKDRQWPAPGVDGGLVIMHMEAGIHVAAVFCLFEALRRKEYLDQGSDLWSHSVSLALSDDLRACGFNRSGENSAEFIQALWKLGGGTPLFGDDFCTNWEKYAVIENNQLAALVAGFRAAMSFKRNLPNNIPSAARKKLKTRLSGRPKEFIGDLVGWLGQIQEAGQDAFILWA